MRQAVKHGSIDGVNNDKEMITVRIYIINGDYTLKFSEA